MRLVSSPMPGHPIGSLVNRTSKLMPHDRELLILRSGWNCRAEYEWAKHVGSVGHARDHGLEPRHIAEGAAASAWSPFEKTLLTMADELYRDRGVSGATWKAMTGPGGYDTGLAMSAVFSAADYQAISMSLNTYGVQLEEGDERFPDLATR
jgi:4-carboxymuconolactone decarboxylase